MFKLVLFGTGRYIRGGTGTYHGQPGSGFAKQDCEASEGVMAALGVDEATWEREDTIRDNYTFLFEEGGTFLVIDIK